MIDNLIVLIYLMITLLIGVYYRSRSGQFKNFANVKGSTRNNKLLLMTTIFVSSVGGGTTFGLAEKSFIGNIAFTYGLLLTIPVDLMVARYIIPKIALHYGAESVGDIMASYYGKAGRILAGIASIIVSVGFLAAQIGVSGRIFQYILKINYIEGVMLSYGIIIIYTTVGGLRSIMFTNFLQFFSMIIAIPVISIAGLKIIGIDNFLENLQYDRIFFDRSDDLSMNTLSATLSFAVMGLYPNFIQRALINRNPKSTASAIYYKSFIYAIFLIFTTLNGLIAFNLYPEQEPALALPFLIDQIIPIGLKGIVVTGLLATVMSTADSDLNVTSISLVKDIFVPMSQEQNQKKLLKIARIANIVIGSGAIAIALSYTTIVDLIVFVAGFWGPVMLVPLIFALFNILISKRMMIINSMIALGIFLIWEYAFVSHYNVKGVFVATICHLILFTLTRLVQKNSTRDLTSDI